MTDHSHTDQRRNRAHQQDATLKTPPHKHLFRQDSLQSHSFPYRVVSHSRHSQYPSSDLALSLRDRDDVLLQEQIHSTEKDPTCYNTTYLGSHKEDSRDHFDDEGCQKENDLCRDNQEGDGLLYDEETASRVEVKTGIIPLWKERRYGPVETPSHEYTHYQEIFDRIVYLGPVSKGSMAHLLLGRKEYSSVEIGDVDIEGLDLLPGIDCVWNPSLEWRPIPSALDMGDVEFPRGALGSCNSFSRVLD